MPSVRTVLGSLAFGGVHAAVLVWVAVDLGYAFGPGDYGPVGLAWRYGGLVLLAAVPAWLVLEHRLVSPLLALALTTGYVVGMELTPPGPTFRDVAELERLSEPTGITVVEHGLYVVRYAINASVWLVGFLLVGLVEYAARCLWEWTPSMDSPVRWLPLPTPRRRAVLVAAFGGLVHAAVMAWFAHRLGLTASGGFR